MSENITFRAHLLGSVSDFSESCEMARLVKPPMLVELIVGLARHREEGSKYFPEVYVCESIVDLIRSLPDHDTIQIGELPLREDSIREVIKKCAPLAVDGWCIYVEKVGESLRFGVFHGSLGALAVPIDDTLLSGGGTGTKVVRVHQSADDCIEIRNHRGDRHNVFLSHRKESDPAPDKYLIDLVLSICDGVKEENRESASTFLRKALRIALIGSRGTLIVVCRGRRVPKVLADGVLLGSPIDFGDLVRETRENKISDSVLLSHAALLKGMISCDGIVVFSKYAELLAYNAFVVQRRTKPKATVGGARKRAFEALCDHLGRGIGAAYIQSQDGWTDFRKI